MKANHYTVNSLISDRIIDIKTSFQIQGTDFSCRKKYFNFGLGETIGFPFEKNTTALEIESVVVPCDLDLS